MIINQIWIGSALPERETNWVRGIRAAAEAAGLEHRLWDWPRLKAAFGHEPLAPIFERAMEWLPNGTVYAFIVDYYQYRVLANEGGVYLDTDMELRGEWPLAADLAEGMHGMPEYFHVKKLCCGMFAAVGEAGRRAARMAAELAEAHILAQISADAPDFESRLVDMVRGSGNLHNGCGPAWLRECVVPAWEAAGIPWAFLPWEVAGHIQWRERRGIQSALTHTATAHWHVDRWQREGYWDQVAAAATRIYNARMRARAREELLAKMCERPTWLRPSARLHLPRARAERRPMSAEPAPGSQQPVFQLPEGTRRILIFSNICRGVDISRAGVQPGDLCIHLNYARHFEELRSTPGTLHVLLVRPRASVRTEWFAPGVLNGYERIIFLRDINDLRATRWLEDYKRFAAGKSPSTGFVAANWCRESWPDTPLLLVGFDPAHQHDTPRWEGHDWQKEAEWYAARGFVTLPPADLSPMKKLLILITSAAAHAERRAACRSTWLSALPPGVEHRFVIGEAEPPAGENDLLRLPVADDYDGLPAKVAAALRSPLAAQYEYVVKCDDDTYLRVDRLLPELRAGVDALGKAEKCKHESYLLGGAGYALSHKALRTLSNCDIPPRGAEDYLITAAIARAGIRLTHSARLHQYAAEPSPTRDNSEISAHELTPAAMRNLHALNAPRIVILLNSCWVNDPAAAAKNARNPAPRAERRAACRDTWLSALPPGITYKFILGTPPRPTTEPDILCTPHADTLQALGSRAAFALRWALNNTDADWIVRSDDDDYIHIPRLLSYIATLNPADIAIHGRVNSDPRHRHLLGGCCQILSRATAATAAADPSYPADTHADDLDLSATIARAGGSILTPPPLQAHPHILPPHLISSFHLHPSALHLLHSSFL